MRYSRLKTLCLTTFLLSFTLNLWASNQTLSVQDDALTDVIVIGNNWDGTIDIYDPHTFTRLKKLNAVPDKEQRLKELSGSLKRLVTSTFIKYVPGEGHHQLVDDMFTSNDGRQLFISRPSFADVIALDINSGEIIWRTPVEGARSDHSALSPDGKTFLVSASSARKVHAIDTSSGKIIGEFLINRGQNNVKLKLGKKIGCHKTNRSINRWVSVIDFKTCGVNFVEKIGQIIYKNYQTTPS